MPAGDEPQLSSENDNAPMISGRGTAVIVTARGAYTAGNLDKLIEMLDERQQFEMQRIVARHAAEYVAGVRPHLLEDCCGAVIRWADDPNDANRAAVEAMNRPRTDGGRFTERPVRSMIATVIEPPTEVCGYASLALVQAQGVANASLYHTIRIGMKRWHLDVAWALLTNHPIPVNAPRNYYDFAELEQNPEAMYQGRNIAALVNMMNPEQQVRFQPARQPASVLMQRAEREYQPYEVAYRETEDAVREWLADAAWAILHDQELPPLPE
jgi:hypothetical protein